MFISQLLTSRLVKNAHFRKGLDRNNVLKYQEVKIKMLDFFLFGYDNS